MFPLPRTKFFSKDGYPEDEKRRKQDREAEDMILIGMITRFKLFELQHTDPNEIFGFTKEELIRRVELFEKFNREI
jgi:hypothetical protein